MMPPDCCKICGDGTKPGKELCAACEKKHETRPAIPGDNWRASVRVRTTPNRRDPRSRS